MWLCSQSSAWGCSCAGLAVCVWTVQRGFTVSGLRLVLAGGAGLLRACLSQSSLPSPVVLYDCSVGHGDCSHCQTAMPQYGCVWCKGESPHCVAREACVEAEAVATQCPAPLIYSVC